MSKKTPAVLNTPVAGNGLLSRRLFMHRSITTTFLAVAFNNNATADIPLQPPWMKEPGMPFSNYGQPAKQEKVIRWIANTAGTTGNGVSWTPLHQLEGTITPNGLHFERHHNGIPRIDPEQHQLLIHGDVYQPLKFSVDKLLRYPLISKICFIECGGNSSVCWRDNPIQAASGFIHGMVSSSEWTGIPMHYLLEECGIKPGAKWVIAEGADSFSMKVSIPLEKLLDNALLALYQNGERIRPENGYPMRLLLPGWEGVCNVKWLRRLRITDQPVMSRNETAKYTELLPSGQAQQFTFTMQVKSVITAPSLGMHLKKPGLYQISGLAWSGHGRIKRVDVSADGGKTWAEAKLDDPVITQSLTRFRIPWHWNGSPSMLMSRATDEQGNIQPTRQQLISSRGNQGYYHYNAITCWKILQDGYIEHSYNES